MRQDKNLYGLSPLDFSPEQIKKIPSPILWRHSKEDLRFENELLSRIRKISDVKNEIEFYNLEDIVSSPQLIELINNLVFNEQDYNIIHPFFHVLNEKNKKYAMDLLFETGKGGMLYERFLGILIERYKYMDSNSKHLIKIIFELLEEKRPRTLVLYLIGHLSKERFDEIYPLLKKKAPNSIIGCLFYYTPYVPREDHLLVLKKMSKLSGLYNIKDKQFKTFIHPCLLNELSPIARLNVLKHISILKTYPFLHKISISHIKILLFPLLFSHSLDVELILRHWNEIDKMASCLPEYVFPI